MAMGDSYLRTKLAASPDHAPDPTRKTLEETNQ